MPVIDGAEEYLNLLWLDVESSGLGDSSYPIEIGVCGVSLEPISFLIRPLSDWGIESWSSSSEKIHGISYDLLIERGALATNVCEWLNAVCNNRTVLSDNPPYDEGWLDRLYDDVGVMRTFELLDAVHAAGVAAGLSRLSQPEAQAILARIHRVFPHPHRAGPDSRRSAAEFMAMAMPWALQEIEEMA